MDVSDFVAQSNVIWPSVIVCHTNFVDAHLCLMVLFVSGFLLLLFFFSRGRRRGGEGLLFADKGEGTVPWYVFLS